MSEIANLYLHSGRGGWAGKDRPEFVKSQFNLIKASFKEFNILSETRSTKGGRMMLYEVVRKVLGKDTENYEQLTGDCFVAGTKVLMADGAEKDIESVIIGDIVVTHFGNKKRVTRTISKNFVGNLVTLCAQGYPRPITSTEDHRFVQIPYKHHRYDHENPQWTSAGCFQEEDRILVPYGLNDESGYENISYNCDSPHRKCVVKTLADEKFARLMGLYLAEGGISYDKFGPSRITFSYNKTEIELAKETVDLITEVFGVKSKVIILPSKPNVVQVYCCHVNVARFFKQLIPGNVYTKLVPDCIFRSKKSVRLALLDGWLEGDGWAGHNTIVGVSASHELLCGMHRLAVSCKLSPKFNRRKKAAHQRVAAGALCFYGESARDIRGETEVMPIKKMGLYNKLGLAVKIVSKDVTITVGTQVYCLEVEDDHSFIANGFAAHNCVGMGAKNAVEYLQATEKLMKGDREAWNPVFAPYLYGTGRVLIGKGQLDGGAGSLGSWMADAVIKYGVLRSNYPNVPTYSGKVADKWGDTPGPDKAFIEEGKTHPVKSAAPIRTWDALVTAITNGYPVTTASNIGYSMQASSDGFHRQTDSWAHQMCWIGVDDNATDPYAILLNTWADAHGQLKDFKTNEPLPIGVLRVRRKDAEKHLRDDDSFAFSNFDGFPEQLIDKALFMLV